MNLFKIRLTKISEDFEKRFYLAFQDINSLAKKLCKSKNKAVHEHLDYIKEWLQVDNKEITINVGFDVVIGKNDAKEHAQIEYDFYKRSPADDNFLFAVMCIFYHHLPDETEFYGEVEPFEEDFDNGVLLARLVNDNIQNPFTGELLPVQELSITNQYIKKVYQVLTNKTPKKKQKTLKKVRFY